MNDPYEEAGLGVQDPIPTDWGDIEDEKSRMSGLVALLLYALGIVSLIGALALAL